MIRQLSIYTENRKGAMKTILCRLSAEEINVLGLVSNDSGEFGTLRLIVSDTDKAVKVLGADGYMCRTTMIAGIKLPDQPGALEKLLEIIENMNINLDYLYVGFRRENKVPLIMLHCEYLDIVCGQLESRGYIVH